MTGCYDTNIESAKEFSDKYSVPVFKNVETLYDKTKSHAVYISVPPCAHGKYEIEAANRGIPFFVEKPIATDLETAKKIASLVRKSKLLTSVGYCFRYSDMVQTAQKILKGKAISLITGLCHCEMPQSAWWRCHDQSGGQIIEQTTHIIDLLLYLCGPVSEVHAMASRGCMSQIENYDIDDSSVLSLRLKTGAVASITSTCVLNSPGRTRIEIVTPERTVHFTGNTLRIKEEHKITEYQSTTDMYALETNTFIKAIQQGKRSGIRSTYADALKTLRVTLAANESINTGMPVKL